ncbi:NAD(P)/FAD-dependent oxidoreductase [Actinoplanes sp. CA-030573]|uniref:NAD(P)/FAD-dependent oxidoreductase n=1 Tax=Actinoplanes sp. CA-030573 TaxID=3239898 RepID=UPI003D917FA8
MDDIVVLGAGYAGMATAIQLAARNRGDFRVTLVDAHERFTERLRLPMTATGQQTASLSIPGLLCGTGARFVRGRVTSVDLGARTVVLDHGTITFDLLVYALGSVADASSVTGAADHAYTLNGVAEAARLADRLGSARQVVVGGTGLTGVESAAEIASRFPSLRVTLVGRTAPGMSLNAKAGAYLRGALDRLGVVYEAGEIRNVLADAVVVDDATLPADVFVWAGGTRVPVLAEGIATDARGRMVTDSVLRSVSHPFVYAAGDAAAIRQPYGIMHGTCQSGMPTGVHAAVSIVRSRRGREPRPFRFGYYHTPISLGRDDAVVQFTHGDDTPRRLHLTGRAAVRYKETVTAAPWPTYRRMKRLPASGAFWPKGRRA